MPDPTIDTSDPDWRTKPALTSTGYRYIQDFQEALNREMMEECGRCKEKWVGLKAKNDICQRCHKVDESKLEEEPFLFSTEDNLDPGPGFQTDGLPELTQIEEQLTARVHVSVEVRQIRGARFRYRGHIINLLRDSGSIYKRLPVLPEDVGIIIIRPRNTSIDARLSRQFSRDFHVRREAIRQWLKFLTLHHPGYSDIVVDEDHLAQLPEDGSVMDRIISKDADEVDVEDGTQQDVANKSEGANQSVVPDLQTSDAEIHGVGRKASSGPSRHTETTTKSLTEFNVSQALLTWAFPTLFHRGRAEFVVPRVRSVEYVSYVQHLLRYRDGRFARHPRFIYAVFNIIMRKQVNTRARFFYKRSSAQCQGLTVDDLRAAFESDAPEAQSLLNSLTRFSGSLRGTRPFWGVDDDNLSHLCETSARHISSSHFQQLIIIGIA